VGVASCVVIKRLRITDADRFFSVVVVLTLLSERYELVRLDVIVVVVHVAHVVAVGVFRGRGGRGGRVTGRLVALHVGDAVVHVVRLVPEVRHHHHRAAVIVVVLAHEILQRRQIGGNPGRQPITELRRPLHAQLVQYRRFDQLDAQRLDALVAQTIGALHGGRRPLGLVVAAVEVLLTVGGGGGRAALSSTAAAAAATAATTAATTAAAAGRQHRFRGDQQQSGNGNGDDRHIRHLPTHQRSWDYRSVHRLRPKFNRASCNIKQTTYTLQSSYRNTRWRVYGVLATIRIQ